MNPTWIQNGHRLKENVNVYRPIIYRLFPKLEQIVITGTSVSWNGDVYPLNPRSLLNVLDGVWLRSSFSTVIIEDQFGKWIKKAFAKKVVAEYKAKGIAVDFDAEYGGHRVIISVHSPSTRAQFKEKTKKKKKCLIM